MCRKSHYERTIKMTSPLSVIVLVIWTSTFCPSWPNNVNPPSMIDYIVDIYDQIKTIYKLTFKGNCSQTIYYFSSTWGQVERKRRLYTLRIHMNKTNDRLSLDWAFGVLRFFFFFFLARVCETAVTVHALFNEQ